MESGTSQGPRLRLGVPVPGAVTSGRATRLYGTPTPDDGLQSPVSVDGAFKVMFIHVLVMFSHGLKIHLIVYPVFPL